MGFLVVIQRKKNTAEYQHKCWCNCLTVHGFLKTEVSLSLFSIWPLFRWHVYCQWYEFLKQYLEHQLLHYEVTGPANQHFYHWAAILLIIIFQGILKKDFKWHRRDILYNIFHKVQLRTKLCTENNSHAFQNKDMTLSHKTTLKIQETSLGYNSQCWLRFFLTNLSSTCFS